MDALSLTTLAQELLAKAREASSGRATHVLYGGRGQTMQQLALALAAGQELAEHDNPGEATLQVIHGQAELRWSVGPVTLNAGDHAAIPDKRHSLHAVEDTVVVLSLVNKG